MKQDNNLSPKHLEFNFPLMRNNITRGDLDKLIEHLKQDDPVLTQSVNVKAFEEEWSEWIGVKYSVFVNSGSSANQLTMSALKIMYPEGGEIIVPPLTWVSDIASILQAGFKPVFVDINLGHLGMDSNEIIKALNNNTRAVFLTYIQGFNALTDELLYELETKNVLLIEDVCESYGATHKGRKLGSFGWVSNYSFYYAHHMSTIEGGMICTDDEVTYENFRMLRSHGMVRESNNEMLKREYEKNYSDLHPDFIFAFPAYNVRNTELGAIIGRSQLRRLDSNNKKRVYNHKLFIENLDSNLFHTNFSLDGSCNYAFNVVLKKADKLLAERLMKIMNEHRIEFRRGSSGGGNQLRQPYLRKLFGDMFNLYPNTEHIHFYGFYIGNYPTLDKNKIQIIYECLNSL